MLKRKVLAIMTSVFFLTGVTAVYVSKAGEQVTQVKTANAFLNKGGPVDLAAANEERIIEMLKQEGKISPNATYQEEQKVFTQFMQEASKGNTNQKPAKLIRNLSAKQNQRVQKYKFNQSTPDTNPKKVNVLVLLVDFNDYKHNMIQPGETDMYYKDYTVQHYQDMLFGESGYKGPNGEKLLSVKQYYQQQSGGSLQFDGKVVGWYSAPKDAAYYGAHYNGGNDQNPRSLIAATLRAAANDPSINLNDYDKEDPYDIDGDGNYNEPDGIIDYLMVLHAGVGEEAGGGVLGENAIWSHSSDLGGVYPIPNTSTTVPYWGGKLGALAYTVEPEDGATGVFAHEFGHNLGLPDEYDTIYSSGTSIGEPISYWSIMSSGSWGGKIPGAEPSGFSPYCKQFFQAVYGGNWQKSINIDFDKLSQAGARVTLRQADEQGQAIRINLPDKKHIINVPTSGVYEYWGGKGQDGSPIDTAMTTSVDLSGKSSASLKFKTWYDTEEGWDFASVWAREQGTSQWTCLQGNITTAEHDPNAEVVVPYGITGNSGGWVDADFSLNVFAGKKIDLKFEYQTDKYVFGQGIYVDDIKVLAGTNEILSDNAEGTSGFTMNGFVKDTGTVLAQNYYLVEWRNQHGVDSGLAHVGVMGQTFAYDPGMVVWYADDFYSDNWTGIHPGEGYLGIVDADQESVIWKWDDPKQAPIYASGKYQMHDAAFSKEKDSQVNIDLSSLYGRYAVDTSRFSEPKFDDGQNYLNSQIPPLGRNIPHLGLKIQISDQDKDNSGASLIIKK